MTLQPPPTLRAPAPGASFATGHVVIFRWHTGRGLSSDLQVADNPAFTNPAVPRGYGDPPPGAPGYSGAPGYGAPPPGY